MVIAYGRLLDTSRWSQTKRAWISFACWVIPQTACFIWIGIEYKKFGGGEIENTLDYKLYVLPRSHVPHGLLTALSFKTH
jgi:hypothetical protein